MSPERLRLIEYVNASSELAEELMRIVKSKNRLITDATVVNLARFYKASKAVQDLLDLVERDNREIQ